MNEKLGKGLREESKALQKLAPRFSRESVAAAQEVLNQKVLLAEVLDIAINPHTTPDDVRKIFKLIV